MCASTADEGKRITESSSSGTFTYECRCHEVSGGYDTLCEWVEVEEDGEESNANYGFVSAELGYTGGYYGMLRARSGSIGPWEQYSIGSSGDTDGTWAIRSVANNLYVSSEFGYSGGDDGLQRARASVIGDWEKFFLYQIGGQFAWQSYYPYGSACCYVSTEMGYTGFEFEMLRARAYSVGSWELYWLDYLDWTHVIASVQGVDSAAPASTPRPARVPGPVIQRAKRVACPPQMKLQTAAPCAKLIPAA